MNPSDPPRTPHNYTESIPVAATLAAPRVLWQLITETPANKVHVSSSFPLPPFLLQGAAVQLSGVKMALFKLLKTCEVESLDSSPLSVIYGEIILFSCFPIRTLGCV